MKHLGSDGTCSKEESVDKDKVIIPLIRTIKALIEWFNASQVDGMIIGGIAASLLGRPRTTKDIDALVMIESTRWCEFLKHGFALGFKPRISDALKFVEKTRVLLLTYEATEIDVDISFGALPFEKEALLRKQWVKISGVSIPLPTPEDLIIMKAVSGRPRDIADIEAIIDTHPKLNLKHIRRWVKEFSRVLEMPEIFENLESIIKRQYKL
jgi:predicted nucleotidyltransferase